MPDDSAAISVQNLRKTYRDGLFRRRRIEALAGVSLDVPRGEVFGLLGPNGAGKTTLIKILLGIVRKTSGTATMLDRPAGDRRGRQRVGFLPENHNIPRHLKGNSALEYYGSLSGLSVRETRRRRDGLLELVGLEDWGNTSVTKYSKGMLQRLGLAQAMLHDPDLLILDEPTDGVDPIGRSEIRDVLKRLSDEGKTIFLNSHLLQEVELVCDRVAILDRGKMLRIGPVDELTNLTDGSQNEVKLELVGSITAIRDALPGVRVPDRVDDSPVSLVISVADQVELDGTVDRLRAADVSVLSLARRKLTLEEVFLQVVRSVEDQP